MKQPKINRVRYWKKEKPKSTWELVGDTEQDLLSVINRGAMYVIWLVDQTERVVKVKGLTLFKVK
jgi:hypothetical protein